MAQPTSKTPKQQAKLDGCPLVVIEWEDAKTDGEYDGPIETAPSEPILCRDCGWLVKITKKTYVLSQSTSLEDDTVRCLTVIPRKLVVRKTEMVPKELENGQNEPEKA